MVRYADLAGVVSVAALVLAGPAGAQGDATHGVALIRDSGKGNCTICHVIPGTGLPDEAQGTIGPPLTGVGGWRSAEEIRAIITDPRDILPGTIMPGYGVAEGLTDVAEAYRGRPILSGDEIDDIVAYLSGLK